MSEATCCSLTFDEQYLQTLNFRSELEDNNKNSLFTVGISVASS